MLNYMKRKSHQQCATVLQTSNRKISRGFKMFWELNDGNEQRIKMQDMQAYRIGSLGVVRLNREYRGNLLTPGFLRQVKRGVETMHHDHGCELIYLTAAKGEHFCAGTDFNTMLHFKENNETDKLVDYLHSIFDLQASFGKMNKPILCVAPGNSYNSGAGLFSACGLPTIMNSTNMAFNEVQFGFVPHAGSTYYLSRLPNNFGTFLSLTGFNFSGKDAVRHDLANSYCSTLDEFEDAVGDCVLGMDPRGRTTAKQALMQDGIYREDKPYHLNEHAHDFLEKLNDQEKSRYFEMINRNKIRTHDFEQFIDPMLRKPDVVANADIAYEKMLSDHSQATHGQGGIPYFAHAPAVFNHYKETRDFVQTHMNELYQDNSVKTLTKHKQLISRCFYSNTVEEIMDNLKRETDPYAKKILDRMERNSMLSMKIALKQFRKADNMDYGQVLKMELNTSLNKALDQDFAYGVKNVLLKSTGGPIPEFTRDVSEAQVDSYFEPNPLGAHIDLEIVENCLLPTKHFYEKYVDSIRVFLNEHREPQSRVREAVELEVKEYFRSEGLNMNDKNFTVTQARDFVYRKFKQERQTTEFIQRSLQMASDRKLRQQYYDKVSEELTKLETDKDGFYQIVNNMISEEFEEAYFQRLGRMAEACEEAHTLDKRRMFLRLKKYLIRSRILTYEALEMARLIDRVDSMPFKVPHMTEHWTQNMREVEHPEIQQSVMWHLSQVVGKQSLAPPVMMQTYLTDPQTAKDVTTYVFDKVALEKLRKDLLQNPEKYEEILHKEREDDSWLDPKDYAGVWARPEIYKKNVYYNWALLNYGHNAVRDREHWPWRGEYSQYKDWADNVRYQSLDTLKLVVSKLLVEFEDNERLGNKVQEFSKNKEESKYSALNRLMLMLNEETESVLPVSERKQLKGPFDKNYMNLKAQLVDLVKEDASLGKLFGHQNDNNLVESVRNELLSDLSTLLSIVLLEDRNLRSAGENERLKQLFSLEGNADQKTKQTAQLELIDDFLATKKGHRSLKRAIEVVKPYFFQIALDRIEEESQTLLSGFRWQENRFDALSLFLAYRFEPKLGSKEATLRIKNWDRIYEAKIKHDKDYPLKSRRQVWRNLLQHANATGVDPQASVAEQEQQLAEAARVQLAKVHHYAQQDLIPIPYVKEEIKKREMMKFDPEASDEIDPEARRPEDIPDLHSIVRSLQDMEEFVINHKHEIDTQMNTGEWLDIYQKIILEHGVDMGTVIQNTRHPEKYRDEFDEDEYYAQLKLINQKYNQEDLKWKDYGNYCKFLQGLQNEFKVMAADKNTEKYLNGVEEFLRHDRKNDQGIKMMLRNQLLAPNEAQNKNSGFIQELDSLSQMRARFISDSETKISLLTLAKKAPEDVRLQVSDLLERHWDYLRVAKLRECLAEGHYADGFKPGDFVRNRQLLRDLEKDTVKAEALHDYLHTPLDVLSLDQTRTLVNMKVKQQDQPLFNQLFDHVEEQLQFVSNERRSSLTLNEFLTRLNFSNSQSLREFSEDLLQQVIDDKFGALESPVANELDIDTVHPGTFLPEHQNIDSPETVRAIVDEIALGGVHFSEEGQGFQKQVYRDAREALEMSEEMKTIRNSYENQILQEYSRPELAAAKVEALVSEYVQIRTNDAMLKQRFASGVMSEGRQVYLKLLREAIVDDLKLASSVTMEDLTEENHHYWGDHWGDDGPAPLHAQNYYNLHHVNNEEAIGFKNIEERAAHPEQNNDLAHDNVFDKMLAEYFLQKRTDVKNSNTLLNQLNEQFSYDLAQLPHFKGAPVDAGAITFGQQYQRTAWLKEDQPQLSGHAVPDLLELDMAINRHLHQSRSAIQLELRPLGDLDLDIPEYFPVNDVRKPVDLYVMETLREIVHALFESRREIEKQMTRAELLTYDGVLSSFLQYENLMPKLKREIAKDLNMFDQQNEMVDHAHDDVGSSKRQLVKTRNKQSLFSKDVLNEDAYYKLLAYTASLQKKRADNKQQTVGDASIYAGYDSFEQAYVKKLQADAKLKPREIDEEALRPKSRVYLEKLGPQLTRTERQEKFFDDHKLYKEGRLEQAERQQLFFVLDQLNQKAEAQPDDAKLRRAGEHLKEFFSDPNNTELYSANI